MRNRITDLTAANARTINKVAQKALEEALAHYGVRVEQVRGCYQRHSGRMRVTSEIALTQIETQDGARDNARRRFEELAPLLGIDGDWYGQIADLSGERMRVTGINPRAKKYPVEVERVRDGKLLKVPATALSTHHTKHAS